MLYEAACEVSEFASAQGLISHDPCAHKSGRPEAGQTLQDFYRSAFTS
jgi:hypothetical protein